MNESFERLITDGFLFEAMSLRGESLRASYGSGYGEGAVIGHPEGLRTWKFKCSALPNLMNEDLIDAGEHGLVTRAQYVWGVFERSNVRNAHKPIWFREPVEGRSYLVEIVEDELDFRMLSLLIYSTGLTLRQRRVFGVASPTEPTAIENPDAI